METAAVWGSVNIRITIMLFPFKAAHGIRHELSQAEERGTDCTDYPILTRSFHFRKGFPLLTFRPNRGIEPQPLCARGWASNHSAIRYPPSALAVAGKAPPPIPTPGSSTCGTCLTGGLVHSSTNSESPKNKELFWIAYMNCPCVGGVGIWTFDFWAKTPKSKLKFKKKLFE